jgi:hypothetical protein
MQIGGMIVPVVKWFFEKYENIEEIIIYGF